VVVNGNGRFTPAHILNGTGVAVPYSLDITTTFTPPGGPTQTQTQTASKGGPHKGAVDCTIPFQSFSGPQGTFTIEGTAMGFITLALERRLSRLPLGHPLGGRRRGHRGT
jgi:hypothetical protein